ncbi:MAG: chemotaxis protein CheW [Nitrospinae bacterium]|nr:chemotaxis protein CheW [Nitrospinota bacterium]
MVADSHFAANTEDESETSAFSYSSILQLVGFKLEKEFFGIDIIQVQEIIRIQDITPVPRSAPFIVGVLNLRGKVIPIIDLRKRFSLPKVEITNHTRIIITQIDVGTIGFVVDQVSEVIRIPKTSVEVSVSSTSEINSEYIKGVGHIGEDGDELLIILDLNKVLTCNKEEFLEKTA